MFCKADFDSVHFYLPSCFSYIGLSSLIFSYLNDNPDNMRKAMRHTSQAWGFIKSKGIIFVSNKILNNVLF